MSTDIITSKRRGTAWARRMRRVAAQAGGLAAVGLLLAACGSSPAAAVAHIGATPTPTGSTAASSQSKGQAALAFSRCMRQHGISNFPDPGSGGALAINGSSGSGLDPRSSQFQAADAACRSLLPNGGQPDPQQAAQMQQAALRFSACMRQHGIANFPDPQFSGPGMQLTLPNGIDPQAPQFQAAQQACQSLMPKPPGGGPGPSTKNSGSGSSGSVGGNSTYSGGPVTSGGGS